MSDLKQTKEEMMKKIIKHINEFGKTTEITFHAANLEGEDYFGKYHVYLHGYKVYVQYKHHFPIPFDIAKDWSDDEINALIISLGAY